MKKILITGINGLIGSIVSRQLAKTPGYTVFGLDQRPAPKNPGIPPPIISPDHFFNTNINDASALEIAFRGIDTVIHLAANPNPAASWENILSDNITGTYHVFEACRVTGVRRVIFASSIRVSLGYQAEFPYNAITAGLFADVPQTIPRITHLDPPRPTEPYGASKLWGEGLARVYSDIHGLSCLCLRVGGVTRTNQPSPPALRAIWCSHRDIAQLIECCIRAGDTLRFDTFYGVSESRYRWVDLAHPAQKVGYVPKDSSDPFYEYKTT